MPVNDLPESGVEEADHFYVKGVKDPVIMTAQFLYMLEHIANLAV
jgi:hypothetical protein